MPTPRPPVAALRGSSDRSRPGAACWRGHVSQGRAFTAAAALPLALRTPQEKLETKGFVVQTPTF